VGPGDQELSGRDGTDAGLGQQWSGSGGEQSRQSPFVVGGFGRQLERSPPDPPQGECPRRGLKVPRAAQALAGGQEAVAFEVLEAVSQRLRSSDHQRVDLVESLAVGVHGACSRS